jgi:hypothetical protein
MKASSRFVSTASLVLCIVAAGAGTALAQGMPGGMAPGMMQGERTTGATNSDMPEHRTKRGMMSSGMMQGMMCPMMRGMMQGDMDQGMMGPGMMGPGTMRSGMRGGMFGSRVTPMMNLSVDDVRSYLGMQLDQLNNKRLKIGNIAAEGGAITAEIVTVDNSLVQRLKVDRHTGAIEYEN